MRVKVSIEPPEDAVFACLQIRFDITYRDVKELRGEEVVESAQNPRPGKREP